MQPVPIDVFTVYKSGSVCDIVPDETPEAVDTPEPADTPDTPDATVDTILDFVDDIPTDDTKDTFTDVGPTDDPPSDTAEEDAETGGSKGCGCSIIK